VEDLPVVNRMFRIIVAHPWAVIACTAIVTIALGFGMRHLAKDDSSDKMLPDNDPILRYTRAMEQVFASDEFLVVAVESPDPFSQATVAKLVRLTAGFATVPDVREVISPTSTKNVTGFAGEISSVPLIDERRPPSTPEELDAYRKAITGKRLFRGILISEDGRSFGFVLRLAMNPDKKAVVAAVQKIVDGAQGPERIVVSGSPAINIQVGKYMARDMARYFPLVILLILATLWLNFRSVRGVLLPFAGILIPVVWLLGLQGWLGVPISVIGTMIPTLVIAVGVSYGVHVLTDYYEQAPGRTVRREILMDTLVSIAPTIALAGGTAVIGFASLMANETPILREFGALTATGIFFSAVVSMTFIPSCLVLMQPPGARTRAQDRADLTARFLGWVADFNSRRRGVAITVGLVLVLGALAGYPRLRLETNAINFFREDDPVRADIGYISTQFGGTITIRTIIEAPETGSILRPEYLRQMQEFQRFLEGFDRVGKTLSIGDMIRDMNQALHEGDPAWDILPETREAAEQLLFVYSMGSRPDEFEGLIDPSHTMATVTARLRQVNARNEPLGTRDTAIILEKIRVYIAANFSPELKVTPTGRAQDIVRSSDYIVKGLIRSMATAIVPIWLLASVIFRSPAAGFFGVVTTGIGLLLNFGVMGWLGLPLDIATTLISSIAIGIGVDDAMHYLLRMRRSMAAGETDHARAMAETIRGAGRAIVFTSVTMVLGFSIFMVASFRPVVYFGGLTALSMITTSVAALFVVPVLLLTARPRFLSRGAPALPSADAEIDNPAPGS